MFRIVLGRLEQAWIGVSLKNFWRLSHLYRLYLILKSTWLPWQIFIPASLNLTSLSTSFGIEVPSILFVGIGRCIFKKFFFMTKCFQNRIDKWFNIACLKSLVDFQACICKKKNIKNLPKSSQNWKIPFNIATYHEARPSK